MGNGRLERCGYQTKHDSEYTSEMTKVPGNGEDRGANRMAKRQGELEVLLERAEFLGERDGALLRAVFGGGQTVREAAALMGEPAAVVRRRVVRLRRKVVSARFMFLVNQMGTFDATTAAVVRRCLLRGEPTRRVAEDLGIPFSRARKTREAVELLAVLSLEVGEKARAA